MDLFKKLKISKRHVAKSLSWRVIGSLDTLLFAWLVTGNFSDGLNVSLVQPSQNLFGIISMNSFGLNLVSQTQTKGILSKPFHGVLLAL